MLLQALHRKGVASRLHLARELHISNSRVCDLIDEMRDEGLLIEKQNGEDRRGRSGVSVRINPNFGHMLGFDMGSHVIYAHGRDGFCRDGRVGDKAGDALAEGSAGSGG